MARRSTFLVVVKGMKETSYPSFRLAQKIADKRGGEVHCLKQGKLPKACSTVNNPATAKREIVREIVSENNHGYHVVGRRCR